MPVYTYEARDANEACDFCRHGFDQTQPITDNPLTVCPRCGHAVRKRYSPPAIGASRSSFDQRAKSAGFHKLQRRGKGEYEAMY